MTAQPAYSSNLLRLAAWLLLLLGFGPGGQLPAQTPCPGLETLATELLAPNKLIQTRMGNFLVSENGPPEPNNGRISIVDPRGNRRTLLDGLPSARTFVGDYNGVTGVHLQGRTLFVLTGQGDVTIPGPVPGTEAVNPTPASPIFSAVLAVYFSTAMEHRTTGVRLNLADHHALKSGQVLRRKDAEGRSLSIRLVADFADSIPEPRPTFLENVRHSHPYGIVWHDGLLYIVDAGMNRLSTVDPISGTERTLTIFPPTPNPRLPVGPPVLENVPTSLRLARGQLFVTLLSGGPFFIPGNSSVVQVDPATGIAVPAITGLSSPIDTASICSPRPELGIVTLEHNLTFPVPGPGRILFFRQGDSAPVTVRDCLTTPTSLVHDRNTGRLVVAEMATGRLLTLELP